MEYVEARTATASPTYDEAITYIQSLGRFGIKLGLDRTRAILAELGNPQLGKTGALISGTNGKGSTSAYLESILRARGLHVGMTPSPHLRSYTERVRFDGMPITERDFAAAVADVRPRLSSVIDRLGQPTEFEILMGVAVSWLAPRADRFVIEVGMGGRLDSTNVLDLGVAVVTNVGLDHRQFLGDTVERIAVEKAGIIKPGNVVVTGATGAGLRVVSHTAARTGVKDLWRLGKEIRLESRSLGWDGLEFDLEGPGFSYRNLRTRLLGRYQAENAALAVAAAHALGDADPESVRLGLETATWPGRLDRQGNRLLFDGAHNPGGLRTLVGELQELIGREPITVVFATMADKDIEGLLKQLASLRPQNVVFSRAASAGERAADPEAMAERWPGQAEVVWSGRKALERARELAGPDGWVLVCGTLYLVGELLYPDERGTRPSRRVR
ncbi:MAG: bifunctional folylpolyglutamate synthase/dihydrofolate synthase [Candidatus Dormibacteraeota bacterium]|nr:bifunctional folylpolyglutamate synthase/dihydrofolate synthase [Candidatus Dormibacteraeota bacterium]